VSIVRAGFKAGCGINIILRDLGVLRTDRRECLVTLLLAVFLTDFLAVLPAVIIASLFGVFFAVLCRVFLVSFLLGVTLVTSVGFPALCVTLLLDTVRFLL
jgi:hypothetical protein